MGLPSGYKRLEYIQSTGTQYINTGFKPNNNTRVVMDLLYTGSENISNEFGAWNSSNNASFICLTTGQNNLYPFYGNASQTVSVNRTARHTVDMDKNVVKMNGTTMITFDQMSFQCTYPMFLCCFNNVGSNWNMTSMRIYSCQIYDNGTLVRDFIPCQTTAGEIGLWDDVNSVFYGNAGTGTFTAGPFTDIKTGDILNYAYTGAVQSVALPKGVYKLEVWGAQGGYRSIATRGGHGGYSVGTLTLEANTQLFIYSGGSGNTGGTSGGFNGGASRTTYNGGGGGSDIRIGQDSLYARVIVAGGGGSDGASSKTGGYGGGETGGAATNGYGSGGGAGTQTAGGAGGSIHSGTFGVGGAGTHRKSGYGGSGGGGWYGGGGCYPDSSGDDDKGGGGGSGYVYTSSTASSYPSGCLLNSAYYLTEAQTIAGNASMPSTTGSTETGHQGNGYVRITVIKAQSVNIPVNIGASWKDSEAIYVNIGGVWKQVESAYVNINRTWKEIG